MAKEVKKKNKCFYCRKTCKEWICKKCNKDRDSGKLDTKGSATLVIYHTV